MKKKIKLTDLKVQSFVTALTEQEKAIAKGGEFTDALSNIPFTFSVCAISVCQIGATCTPYAVTKFDTCEFCTKPKN